MHGYRVLSEHEHNLIASWGLSDSWRSVACEILFSPVLRLEELEVVIRNVKEQWGIVVGIEVTWFHSFLVASDTVLNGLRLIKVERIEYEIITYLSLPYSAVLIIVYATAHHLKV